MDYVYAPWRGYYSRNTADTRCLMCIFGEEATNDAHYFIIARYTHVYVLLNRYPYNTGHIMIVPYTHGNTLNSLAPESRAELMIIMHETIQVLNDTLNPQGFNVGVNLGGKVAGGSMPDHLHFHIVPRWLGDTNFMVTIADTKPIVKSLTEVYTQLKNAFEQRKA